MKKKGLLVVLLALMLATAGVVYATWTDTLNINASISAGNIGMSWVSAGTDDDGDIGDHSGNDNGLDPKTMHRSAGYPTNAGIVERQTKNVGSCQMGVDGNGDLTIVIDKAYPGYTCSIFADAKNGGTVPVIPAGGTLTVAKAGWGGGQIDCLGDEYSGGATGCGKVPFAATFGGGVEFTFDFADGIACWSGGTIDPNGTNGLIMWFQVEDAATQGAVYTISSSQDFVNWNEWSDSLCTFNGVHSTP